MPDSGMMSPPPHHPQPPFYSPPQPPPPGSGWSGEDSYHGYNGDNNGNPLPVNGDSYPMRGGSRSVSFSPHQNPNDPNNNSGGMLEEGNGGGGGGNGPMQNGGDMYQTHHQRDLFEEIRNGGGHWSQLLRQVVLSSPEDFNTGTPSTPGGKEDHGDGELGMNGDESGNNVVPLQVVGGSENGQFVYVGITNGDINRWITVGYLQPGDIILEIQGQQVAGYTQADVISLLHHCLRGNSATLTVAPRGSLGPELRSYLNTRFQKGSVDHALQGVVRDNLYLRTVPVTTRTPRPGEINGVDYTFLSVEEFMQLERDGSLLESGVYAGNHYGTPKPWARLTRTLTDNPSEGTADGHLPHNSMIMAMEMPKGPLLPGMHPSSEGKRRRNRSNVEALGAGGDEDGSAGGQVASPPGGGSASGSGVELGPLPANWEMSYTDNGEVYFIDHNTGTSHWLDPRLSRVQKLSLEDCTEDELPFGWERIEDPHYGVYYIDHVNRRTQFENPVIQAKQAATTGKGSSGPMTNGNVSTDSECDSTSKFLPEHNPPPPHNPPPQPPLPYFQGGVPSKRPQSLSGKPIPPAPNPKPQNRLSLSQRSKANDLDNLEVSSAGGNGLRVKPVDHRPYRFFTRDPLQLIGERIITTLVKSNRGLGFTIVGGDDDDGLDEFLQIKSVVTDGPAWNDGKLRTGDVLVTVNGTCVLGYTHQEMVAIFQSISPGQDVQLEVCRGYPLPFDPADPNTEIVTTVAVAPIEGTRNLRPASPDSLTHSAHSLPELSNDKGHGGHQYHRPASVDLLLDSPKRYPFGGGGDLGGGVGGQVCIVTIVKGQQGFGFTIADSVTGQKVKKVLDQSHSGDLEEGDRLIALDGLDLRGLSHTQVVQILKDFPVGREASLTIQRTPPNSPYNGGSGLSSSPPKFFGAGAGRSKTPTAELARGRPRFRDNLPERPKTPQGGLEGRSDFMNGIDSSLYNGGNPAPPPAGADLNWVELTIELQRRQEGFGFRIVGGTEEGSQVSVGHIVPGGAAALDGRLHSGDQLVFVEGCSVIGASHHSVVQLMARSANQGKVRLTVRRPVYSNSMGVNNTIGGGPASDTTAVVVTPIHSPTGGGGSIASVGSGSNAPPIHVTLKRQPSEGFGFVIISSASKAGATIGKIVEGSPADRCGELHVGDRILAVNSLDISQLHHTQVVQLIKESGFVLTLSVLPVMTPQTPQPSMGSPGQQAQQSMQFTSGGSGMEAMENLSLKDSTDPGFGGPEGHGFGGEGETVFSVHLSRGNRGFGFSIRGGKEFQNMPLFVLRLADDGPAAMDGRMQVGDQILQINGINTVGMTHAQAIHLIKTGGASVHLLLRRGAVPFPFLNQMPSFSSGGFGSGSNGGQELEEQSLSNASNNNSDQQFISQSQSATQLYREHHHHHAGF